MFTSADNIIYAIIRKRTYDLLRPELVDYFTGIQHHLYAACFMCRMTKVDPTLETVTNYINNHSTIKTAKEKQAVISHLHDITNKKRYVDVTEVEELLESEFYERRYNDVVNTLKDSKATTEMKKDIISKTSEIINRTRKLDDFASIKQLLQKFRNEYNVESASNYTDKLIKLDDDYLKMIFDDTIYPHMYSILGRPNDFKTTLLLLLIQEFNFLKKKGILISLEDSAMMAGFKILSMRTGIDKKEIIQHQYDPIIFDSSIDAMQDNIYVMDKMRTSDELYIDLKNKLNTGDFKWIAIDYMQCIKGEKYLSEYEKISNLDRRLMEINKEFEVPIFRLTQTDKASMSGNSKLGLGSEKGSGEIAHNSRYALAINPPSGNCEEQGGLIERHITVYKTTFCKKGTYKVGFEGATGRIKYCEPLGENL